MAEHRPRMRVALMRFRGRREAAAYAAGIIDGEGNVSVGARHRAIRVSNTEPAILDAYTEALDLLGITWTRTSTPAKGNNSAIEQVAVFGRRNLEIASKEIPLQSAKRDRLLFAVRSFVLPHYRRKHEVQRSAVERLIGEGMTHREIAEALGLRSHSNAQYYLKKFGLQTRRSRKACGLL